MTDSKLIETLRVFAKEELEEFALFIASPYFNRGAYAGELSGLFAYILAASPDFEAEKLDKEVVHSQLFPGKPYSEGRISRMMFEINRLAKEFLMIQHYNRAENAIRNAVDWMTILRARGLRNRLEKEEERAKVLQESLPESIEKCHSQYLLMRELHEWRNAYNHVKDDIGLSETIRSFDHFCEVNRLELLNRFLLQQKASSFEIPEFMQAILDAFNLSASLDNKNTLLQILTRVHSLLRRENYSVAEFQELMELLKTSGDKIEPESLAEFYVYLRNLCALLINNGATELETFMHALHRDNLHRGYFYTDGKITANATLSIVQHALRASNIEWAYHFLEEHRNRIIGETETHDYFSMNIALCLFFEKKYQEVLEHIPFGLNNLIYQTMARRLELKTYYELNSDILPSKVDAFKMFVSRIGKKSLSTDWAELYANFGNFVSQLSQSMPGDKKRSEQLEKRIREKRLVGERAWLIEKAQELAAKKR